jgi:polyhydroxybutyrate depolymerase
MPNTSARWFVALALTALIALGAAAHRGAAETPRGPLNAGRHTLSLVVDGRERNYVVQVPAGYAPATPIPLVFFMHGGGGTARAAIWETGWAEKADASGFAAVFPNALARDPTQRSHLATNPQLWNDGSERFYDGQSGVNDVRFIAALIDELSARLAIDKRRVYLSGFSNGASMSFLAGAKLSGRIAAIAPVAGACWTEPATPEKPVSMLYITGDADPLNLIDGGIPKLADGRFDPVRAKAKPPVAVSISRWANAQGCPATPRSTTNANGVRTVAYGPCRDGAQVVSITVEDLGHTWAGGRSLLPESAVGKTSNKINATDIIWEFFKNHPAPVR